MSNYPDDGRPKNDSSGFTIGARKKIRPTYSCLNCHKRKVKCDRVKPCGACCLRGTPSECEYGTSKKDRHYIQQSTLIENLTRTCDSLRRQLDEARRLANLPPIKHEESSGGLYRIRSDGDDETIEDAPDLAEGSPPERLPDPFHRSTCPSSLSHSKKQLTDPALATAVMDLFVERLISNFSPKDHAKYGGTIALREASEMRMLSPIICNAFEAASLTFAGRRDRNLSVEVAGHSRYVRVLRQLQNALYDPKQSHSTEVLVAILLATIIEAFKQSSSDSIFRHQLGGLELLRTRTPYRHRYGIERSLFVDLRLYWITAALVHRKPTFMASKEWLSVPWPDDAASKDILHRLLDIAVDIPGYLYRIDEFMALLQEGTTAPSQLVAMQSAIWEQAGDLQARLNSWKTVHADTYPLGAPSEELDDETADGFPVFRCRNPSTMHTTTATILQYPDILLATSMCFYWAFCLVISATDSGLVSVLGLQERYQFACNICRSMKYYIQNIPGCLVSRIMFVLRTALDAFADGMIEKEFLVEVFRYIGKKLEFPVFSNQCTSSAVKPEYK
ncbi:putative C6 finger domain protein [Aspergillus steynii IBT 23096]|uniref:Putative C6 finger domain protein n=1 Tax=Aspergillus steynii IBT 23096 TaxID=1392250 RepID=A0A2I2FXI0_9EURO|nr:putative C6 finger domain protein [Aspergillus steynii IBT 23096]PLB45312.1 putative C6 finger domain protein [Aspergillus steynii IBT 23096]